MIFPPTERPPGGHDYHDNSEGSDDNDDDDDHPHNDLPERLPDDHADDEKKIDDNGAFLTKRH